jgi:hypothetical protein
MSQKILVALGIAAMLGVASPGLAQTPPPLPPAGGTASGQTGASAGAGTSTDSGGSSTTTEGGAQTGAGAGTDAGTGGTTTQGGAGTDAGAGAGGTTTQSGGTTAGGASSTTDAGAHVSVDVTTEQQTEIHQAITEVNVAPVTSVDFDVSIGTAVPTTITLTPLPVQVVKIVPQFEGYLFFLLPDGRIVIVEPSTLHIVYILST